MVSDVPRLPSSLVYHNSYVAQFSEFLKMESHGFLGCLPWKTANEDFPLDVVVKNSVVTLLVISIITEGLLVVHFRYYVANTEEVVWLTLAIPLRNRYANLQLVLGNIILSCGELRRHDTVVFLRNAVSWDLIRFFLGAIVAVLRSFSVFSILWRKTFAGSEMKRLFYGKGFACAYVSVSQIVDCPFSKSDGKKRSVQHSETYRRSKNSKSDEKWIIKRSVQKIKYCIPQQNPTVGKVSCQVTNSPTTDNAKESYKISMSPKEF